MKKAIKKIVIFISGYGSNAENIIKHFQNSSKIKVCLILSNNKKSRIIEISKKYKIPFFLFTNEELSKTEKIINELANHKIDLIVLAGFLRKIPPDMTKKYVIINIHPSLLPKYGGKGMYGDYVHKKVLENKDKSSGITIHFVNEKYDKGNIIFQKHIAINPNDQLQTLKNAIQHLEYKYYPIVIQKLLD